MLFSIDLTANECFGVVFTNLKANGAALERGAVAFISGALDTQGAQVREAATL